MKHVHLTMMTLFLCHFLSAQTRTPVEQAVEGGKVLVDLIRVFSNDKEGSSDAGCKGRYADLCVINQRDTTLAVIILHRVSTERRELIIARDGKECSLHLPVGVWTYDLKQNGTTASIRKGDLLIEGCNDLTMTIR